MQFIGTNLSTSVCNNIKMHRFDNVMILPNLISSNFDYMSQYLYFNIS